MDDRFARLRDATASSLFRAPGATPTSLREAVARGSAPSDLAELVRKIQFCAHTISDQDIDVLRTRYTEDQLFEIIIAAAFGAGHERLTAGRRALEQA